MHIITQLITGQTQPTTENTNGFNFSSQVNSMIDNITGELYINTVKEVFIAQGDLEIRLRGNTLTIILENWERHEDQLSIASEICNKYGIDIVKFSKFNGDHIDVKRQIIL